MSFSIHLHGGELGKLIELCVDAYMTGAKSLTTQGSCKKSDERYRRAEEKLICFTKNLTPDQRGLIDGSFKQVIALQSELGRDGLSKKEKKKLAALYKKATKDYEMAVEATSTQITHDLVAHMSKAESYMMAVTCDEHDVNALEMAKGILSEFNRSFPKALKQPKRQASSDSPASQQIPANMMKQITQHVKDVKRT